MKNNTESLPARLTRLRVEAGLSINALARKAGLAPAVYHRIESGERPDPRWSSMKAIATALGVPLDELR